MATLTEASEKARMLIKYGGIGFVVITLMWYTGVAAIAYWKKLHPPAAPPPTVDFGMLPAINFPKEGGRPTMLLELPQGSIPEYPDRMVVYSAPTKRSGFLDATKSTNTARLLGFLSKPEIKTDSDYVWTNQDQLSSRLEMNIVSGHFMMTRQWQNNPGITINAYFQSKQQVIANAEAYLKKTELLTDDIVGVEKVSYLRDDAGKLAEAWSLSDAHFVQLDLFRKNIDEYSVDDTEKKEIVASYPFYRPDPNKGLVRIVWSSSPNPEENPISVDYQNTIVNYLKNGTYPIKTGFEAWNELKNGGGFVASGSPTTGEIKIRKMFLGYYDSDAGQNYAMPIYIFLGDQSFVAYVSAVSETWVKK